MRTMYATMDDVSHGGGSHMHITIYTLLVQSFFYTKTFGMFAELLSRSDLAINVDG